MRPDSFEEYERRRKMREALGLPAPTDAERVARDDAIWQGILKAIDATHDVACCPMCSGKGRIIIYRKPE